MNDLTKLLLASTIAGTLAMGGCGSESGAPETDSHAEHDDHGAHDHGEDGHDDHDHAEGEHDEHADGHMDDHDEHGHAHAGETRTETVEINGTVLEVVLPVDVEPNTDLHLDINYIDGPFPAALRLWVGDEAATNAIKSKADAHGDHYHAHADVPGSLENVALWLEVESEDGGREAGSISID